MLHRVRDTRRQDTESCKLQPMEWTDEGIVLGVRRHGESSAIVELLTRGHGRHLGLVRGGSGSRMRPLLQPGNSVRAVWRGRVRRPPRLFLIGGNPPRPGPPPGAPPPPSLLDPPGPPAPPVSGRGPPRNNYHKLG